MVEYSKKITSELSSEGIYGFAANLKNPTGALTRSLSFMADLELGIQLGFDFAKGEYDFTGYGNLTPNWKELTGPECAFRGIESLDIDPLCTQFADGKIGMYISWTHAEPGVYLNQFPMEQEWAVAELPTSGGTYAGKQNYNLMNAYLFNAESKNIDAAWIAYTELFMGPEFLTEYYESGLGVTIVPEVIENSNPPAYYTDNPALLLTEKDGLWPKTPHEINPDAVVVEGLSFYDTFASMLFAGVDIDSSLTDLIVRYNAAYRAGIEQELGEEIMISDFNSTNPIG